MTSPKASPRKEIGDLAHVLSIVHHVIGRDWCHK